ncbi:MAG: rRNA maturation RNase YbeY [candidate division WOR-3 bacterium]|nr:rRNA maturation RNase YbeY [candidate division WOR-3 bacterium]
MFGTRDESLRADIQRLCRLITARRGQSPGPESITGDCPHSVVNFIFVNDRQIHALNRRFLHRDRPTNVISFNCNEPQLPGEPSLLGEVYISRDRAREQAREYGVTYASELRRLALHGLLHLLGLTHRQMEPYYGKYLPRGK